MRPSSTRPATPTPRYLAPDGLALRLDASDAIKDGDGAVEDTQGTLHLQGEVHVPRRVDDVDP
eukprot:7533339-Prorocentrum_lima.AAC.1